jgi:protein Mpv17
MKPVLIKSIAGQVLVFPPYVFIYLSITTLLNRLDYRETMTNQFPKIVTNGALVWPFVNIINFKFVPIPYRLLFINVIGVGWNSYLSFETYNKGSLRYANLLCTPLIGQM